MSFYVCLEPALSSFSDFVFHKISVFDSFLEEKKVDNFITAFFIVVNLNLWAIFQKYYNAFKCTTGKRLFGLNNDAICHKEKHL